jgi:hypothetical protein
MSRGGKREGAGRKPNSQSSTSTVVNNAGTYTPKIDPVKELEKLFKKVDKVSSKEELMKLQIKIDLLNKMLPYVSYKKPTAETKKEDNPTTVEIKGIDLGDL